MNAEDLKKYYEQGWEIGLLDLVRDEVLKKDPMKFRISASVSLVQVDSSKKYNVLDVGCGVGTSSFLIGKKYKNMNFTCVDISAKQLLIGKKYAESIRIQDRYEFVIGDVNESLPCFDRYYDYVICCEVLEHMPDPSKLLENCRSCGNDSTKYIFSFPLGKNKNDCIMYRVIDENGRHFVVEDESKASSYVKSYAFYHRLYSVREAKLLLERNGFRVIKSFGSGFLRGHKKIRYYFLRITNYSLLVDKTINRLAGDFLAENVTFLCHKS